MPYKGAYATTMMMATKMSQINVNYSNNIIQSGQTANYSSCYFVFNEFFLLSLIDLEYIMVIIINYERLLFSQNFTSNCCLFQRPQWRGHTSECYP